MLNSLARGRLDMAKVRQHWPDITRLVASIYTSEVSPYDVVRMLQRDGHPVLWNTTYIDDALTQLHAQGHPVRNEDVARLSPFICKHINVHGRYSFYRHDQAGGRLGRLGVLARLRPRGRPC
ncbi:hypothetical protein FHR32_007651 [Streptosporangium album]|uniref:Tn3 transposase DDE domain-containing protein n=1 Tax=Streptosporangium album TaxID=47479 RepID=A0A7W7S3J3_9ACTN|nr:hypothetical protein [Streptosporangium album]